MNAQIFQEGQLILIDKPLNWTSFQVVNKIRWAIRRKYNIKKIKVGHAGTLDPLATGLLLICTGKFTKGIDKLQAETKEYTGEFTIGATTPSYDMETVVDKTTPIDNISDLLIHDTTNQFVGDIKQKPPLFSAIKKDGVRLYEHARRGESVIIQKRAVTIFKFEITKINIPKVEFLVSCSKGTYIRSLANDFGEALGCGAYLSALRRTKSGNYDVKDGIDPEKYVANLS